MASTEKLFYATGRRKTAVARVRVIPASKTSYEVNSKPIETYLEYCTN